MVSHPNPPKRKTVFQYFQIIGSANAKGISTDRQVSDLLVGLTVLWNMVSCLHINASRLYNPKKHYQWVQPDLPAAKFMDFR